MPHYEFMHYPGVDMLGRHIERNTTIKQVASAAEQLGKERTFCEVYGCIGQQCVFTERKWIADCKRFWVLILSILICHCIRCAAKESAIFRQTLTISSLVGRMSVPLPTIHHACQSVPPSAKAIPVCLSLIQFRAVGRLTVR